MKIRRLAAGNYEVHHGGLRFVVARAQDGDRWIIEPDGTDAWAALGRPDRQAYFATRREAIDNIIEIPKERDGSRRENVRPWGRSRVLGTFGPFVMVEVSRVRDAHGALCRDCEEVVSTMIPHPYWGWRKLQHMHESGTGHRMDTFKYEKTES